MPKWSAMCTRDLVVPAGTLSIPPFAFKDCQALVHATIPDSVTEIGKEAKGHMDEGRLVPDDLMIRLIMNDATSIVGEGKSLLLDGFPRTLDQARALDESVKVDLVVNLDNFGNSNVLHVLDDPVDFVDLVGLERPI